MTGWRLSSRDWASRMSSREMDVGSAVTPKICDQVLTVCADEAGVASHGGRQNRYLQVVGCNVSRRRSNGRVCRPVSL